MTLRSPLSPPLRVPSHEGVGPVLRGSPSHTPRTQSHSPESLPSLTILPSNMITTSRRLQTPLEPHQVLTRVKVKVRFPIARHSTSRAKAKAKENSPRKVPRKAPRKAPNKAPRKAPRKDPSKALEKVQERAKAPSVLAAGVSPCAAFFPWLCGTG